MTTVVGEVQNRTSKIEQKIFIPKNITNFIKKIYKLI